MAAPLDVKEKYGALILSHPLFPPFFFIISCLPSPCAFCPPPPVFSLFSRHHHNLSSSPRALHSPPSPSSSSLLSDAKLFNKESIRVCSSEGSRQTVLGWFRVFLFVSSRYANLKLSIWIQELCLGRFFFLLFFFSMKP